MPARRSGSTRLGAGRRTSRLGYPPCVRALTVVALVLPLASCRLLGVALPCAEDGDCASGDRCRSGQCAEAVDREQEGEGEGEGEGEVEADCNLPGIATHDFSSSGNLDDRFLISGNGEREVQAGGIALSATTNNNVTIVDRFPIHLVEGSSIAVRFSGLVVQGFDDLIFGLRADPGVASAAVEMGIENADELIVRSEDAAGLETHRTVVAFADAQVWRMEVTAGRLRFLVEPTDGGSAIELQNLELPAFAEAAFVSFSMRAGSGPASVLLEEWIGAPASPVCSLDVLATDLEGLSQVVDEGDCTITAQGAGARLELPAASGDTTCGSSSRNAYLFDRRIRVTVDATGLIAAADPHMIGGGSFSLLASNGERDTSEAGWAGIRLVRNGNDDLTLMRCEYATGTNSLASVDLADLRALAIERTANGVRCTAEHEVADDVTVEAPGEPAPHGFVTTLLQGSFFEDASIVVSSMTIE